MRNLIALSCLFYFTLTGIGQTTNISGVVNTYTQMTNISGNTITVSSSAGFSAGDKIMIIQMQGAKINENNTAQFGEVTNLKNAGKYEYTKICEIDNNDLQVTGIERSYSDDGSTQIIRVPVYENAIITSPVHAQPWDGNTGGVIALECNNSLTFNSDIDAVGAGFRGGETTTSSYNCSWLINVNDYFYNINTGQGAKKGEGIAKYITGKTGGKGPQSNGGGGSNDHNGGGGGGANINNGGIGGQRIAPTGFSCSCTNPGLGGNDLGYNNNANRIYLGGGGGAGHENNVNTGTDGSNGGGIVLIKAETIIGNGNLIDASASDVIGNSADGAGGGGAGGTVLIDATSYSGTLNINVSGADGGGVANVGNNCNGPGGGGSGGVVWVSQASIPGNLLISNDGGIAGTTITTTQGNCTLGSANSATDGDDGANRTDLQIPESNCNAVIPIGYTSDTICAEDSIFLAGAWQHTTGVYIDTITSGCCDSVVETTLTVLTPKSGNYSDTICSGDSVVINGTVYKEVAINAQEIFTGIGSLGCDSTVSVNISVTETMASFSELDTASTDLSRTLIADQDSATYQWILCPNQIIDGATNQDFIVSETGSYAVVVSKDGCSDTSDCALIEILGNGVSFISTSPFSIYPNPTKGYIAVESSNALPIHEITLVDLNGRILIQRLINSNRTEMELDVPSGIYSLHIESESTQAITRIVKL